MGIFGDDQDAEHTINIVYRKNSDQFNKLLPSQETYEALDSPQIGATLQFSPLLRYG